jgi:hypothetical protein
MSKFDAVYKRIEEMLPVTPPVAGTQPKPAPSAAAAQQPPLDPKIVQELIAAKTEQQVQIALQKMQALQAAKPGQQPVPNQQPAV